MLSTLAGAFSRGSSIAGYLVDFLPIQEVPDYGEDQVIRIDEQYASAYYNRGATYEYLGVAEESERDFQKAKEPGNTL